MALAEINENAVKVLEKRYLAKDENGQVTAMDLDRLDKLLQGYSAGSVQLRGMDAAGLK